MHVAAVHLDDEALRAPQEVGFGAAAAGERDPGVDVVRWQADRAADLQERLFQIVAGDRAAERVLVQDGGEERRAAAAGRAREDVVDGAHIERAPLLGCVDRALDLARRCVLRHVEQVRARSSSGSRRYA